MGRLRPRSDQVLLETETDRSTPLGLSDRYVHRLPGRWAIDLMSPGCGHQKASISEAAEMPHAAAAHVCVRAEIVGSVCTTTGSPVIAMDVLDA